MGIPTPGLTNRKQSRQQGLVLENWLKDNNSLYPSKEEKHRLANSAVMSYHQVGFLLCITDYA